MHGVLTKSGSVWVDHTSGEVFEDLAELLAELPEGAKILVVIPDEEGHEADDPDPTLLDLDTET